MKKELKPQPDFWAKVKELLPIIKWSMFDSSEKNKGRVYKFKIYKLNRIKYSSLGGIHNGYIKYTAKCLEKVEYIGLREGTKVEIHFSAECYKNALALTDLRHTDPDKDVDVILHFSRPTKKTMMINKIQVLDKFNVFE